MITSLTPEQWSYLQVACKGHDLVEVGGATGALCKQLLEHGARSALNIEKERLPFVHAPKLTHYCGTVQNFLLEREAQELQGRLVVLCWPVNYASFSKAVCTLLQDVAEIIYIGKNDGVTACGTTELWEYLSCREVIQWIFGPVSTVIHYRNRLCRPRELLNEEKIGLTVTS